MIVICSVSCIIYICKTFLLLRNNLFFSVLEKPKDITVISYGQGKFNLTWKASNQRPYNFTLYWCKTLKPPPSKCDGPLEWLHTTKTKHILHLPDKQTSYQFAVSANDDGYTSGMSWASCIVYYKGGKFYIFFPHFYFITYFSDILLNYDCSFSISRNVTSSFISFIVVCTLMQEFFFFPLCNNLAAFMMI